MKSRTMALLSVVLLLSFSVWLGSQKASGKSPAADSSETNKFLGRWDLTLKAPDREYPSWIEISEEDGQLHAQFVSRWGNARPLPQVSIAGDHLQFTSPKKEEERKDDMVFEGTLSNDLLSGTTTGPDGSTWTWTGRRAPSLKRTGNPKWGKSIALFNGKDLTGWRMSETNSAKAWIVEDGALITPGNGPELINDLKFEDFELHVEFNCAKGSNSGVYLRGRYELQIEDDPEPEGPTMRTGGIYGFLAPSPEQPRRPDEWQTYDITLVGRTITVAQNGKTIIDNKEIPGITGGALDSHEELPGPIYLQGSERGHVAYRSIVITPAKR